MLKDDIGQTLFRETLIDLTWVCDYDSHEVYLSKLLIASIGGTSQTNAPSYLEISNMVFDVTELLKLLRSLERIFNSKLIKELPAAKPIYDAIESLDYDVVMYDLTSALRNWIHSDDPDYLEPLGEIARMANLYQNINELFRQCYEFVEKDETTRELKEKQRQCV